MNINIKLSYDYIKIISIQVGRDIIIIIIMNIMNDESCTLNRSLTGQLARIIHEINKKKNADIGAQYSSLLSEI